MYAIFSIPGTSDPTMYLIGQLVVPKPVYASLLVIRTQLKHYMSVWSTSTNKRFVSM